MTFKTRVTLLIFAIIKVQDLEEELGRVSERLTDTEAEAMSQQVNIKHLVRNYAISLSFEIYMQKRPTNLLFDACFSLT